MLASLALQLLGLSVPLLTKTVVNTILPQQLDDVMTILGLGILVILVTQLLMGLLRGLILVNFQARLDNELMVSFFEHVLSLPLPYFQERSTGDLIQRLSSNAQIRNVLSTQTLERVPRRHVRPRLRGDHDRHVAGLRARWRSCSAWSRSACCSRPAGA